MAERQRWQVEQCTIREGQIQWIGNVKVVVAYARGGQVVVGTSMIDECGPMTTDEGLLTWAHQRKLRKIVEEDDAKKASET